MDRCPIPQRLLKSLAVDEITQARIVERISFGLRRCVGTGRPWSYVELAAHTSIDIRTVKAYTQGTACPNMVRFKRMLSVLGPDVCCTLDATTGWRPRAGAIPPEALDLQALAGEIARAVDILSSVIDKALAERLARPGSGDGTSVAGRTGPANGPAEARAYQTKAEFLAPVPTVAIDEQAIARRISYRLDRMMAPNGPWRIDDVAHRARIDLRTLHRYVAGTAVPNLTRYIRLQRVMGPEVGVELALMLGWHPRHGRPPAAGFERLAKLRADLVRSKESIDAVLDRRAAPEPPHLIWRADRADERKSDA